MKTIATILLLTMACSSLQAQRDCGSDSYFHRLIQSNPSAAASISLAEQQLESTLKNKAQYQRRDTSANEIINIPVVVHILYKTAAQNISDAQVISQLVSMNKDFSGQNEDRVNTPDAFKMLAADTRIRFCLAQVDQAGRRTNGINRKKTANDVFTADDQMKYSMNGGADAWDSKKYLNIWICNLSGRTLGYASLPGGPADRDGIVIAFDAFGTTGTLRASFNKGRTATHEVGHWLGLKHLWGDSDCGDDEVDDTPKQKNYNFGCPSFPHLSDCSPNSNGDMFMNYMDFSDDGCMNMFTHGQKKRMRALFATGNARNSFLHSFACDSSLAQGGPLPGPTPEPEVKKDAYSIYPNPVQDIVTIGYKPGAEMTEKTFNIYNSTGVNVVTGSLTKEKNVFNLGNLPAGIYFIRIGEGKGSFTSKIFKQ